MPTLVGGSADLGPSNNTDIKDGGSFQHGSYEGRIFHFGVREHGDGRDADGHEPQRRAHTLRRHLHVLLRLHEARHTTRRALARAGRLRLHARLRRTRRRRPDAPAHRTTRGPARHPESLRDTPGRRARSTRGLASRDTSPTRADRARAHAPEGRRSSTAARTLRPKGRVKAHTSSPKRPTPKARRRRRNSYSSRPAPKSRSASKRARPCRPKARRRASSRCPAGNSSTSSRANTARASSLPRARAPRRRSRRVARLAQVHGRRRRLPLPRPLRRILPRRDRAQRTRLQRRERRRTRTRSAVNGSYLRGEVVLVRDVEDSAEEGELGRTFYLGEDARGMYTRRVQVGKGGRGFGGGQGELPQWVAPPFI
jgi:hypothetical protein